MFYGDMVIYGYISGLMCGYDFFGVEYILFVIDMFYDS